MHDSPLRSDLHEVQHLKSHARTNTHTFRGYPAKTFSMIPWICQDSLRDAHCQGHKVASPAVHLCNRKATLSGRGWSATLMDSVCSKAQPSPHHQSNKSNLVASSFGKWHVVDACRQLRGLKQRPISFYERREIFLNVNSVSFRYWVTLYAPKRVIHNGSIPKLYFPMWSSPLADENKHTKSNFIIYIQTYRLSEICMQYIYFYLFNSMPKWILFWSNTSRSFV